MNDSIQIAVSGLTDGSMSKAVEPTERDVNRKVFLERNSVSPNQTVLVQLTYDTENFLRYSTVDVRFAGDGITRQSSLQVDALFTRDQNLALFLPVADCIGMVLFDPVNKVLGLSHIGRHNLVQHGGSTSVQYMKRQFGTESDELKVWLSPAAGKDSYPLHDFDGKSLHEVALEQLQNAGVNQANIVIDTRDTTKDTSLFSHSEFLKGNRATDGRQAVVAMMRASSR